MALGKLSPIDSMAMEKVILRRFHGAALPSSIPWLLCSSSILDFDLVLYLPRFLHGGRKMIELSPRSATGRHDLVQQVMTVGQTVTFEYLGQNFVFTVNQAEAEGKQSSNIERGMLSTVTYIVFQASSSSGIKIVTSVKQLATTSLSTRSLICSHLVLVD